MIGAALANHLWQSTLCVGAAAVLAWMLRHHAARFRYRVWLLASLKFLLPFSLLIGLGRHLPAVHLAARPTPLVSVAVRVIGEPFAPNGEDGQATVDTQRAESPLGGPSPGATDSRTSRLVWFFGIAWAIGSLVLLVSRWASWRRLMKAAWGSPSLHTGREADALDRARARLRYAEPIDLRSSRSLLEPGVIGTTHPIILWPASLTTRLTDAELDAIFVHELSHVRRRDNLAAGLHALLETVLWFHPIVWWLGARLVAERERACDEEVLRVGSERQAYAASILKVCDFCLQSPVSWVAGVTGAHLKARVEEIMTYEKTRSLRRGHRALLAMTALLLVGVPVGLGALRDLPSAATTITGRAMPSPAIEPVARIEPAQAATGGVTGVITDPSGGLLIGALVTIAGTQRTAVTDADGRYILTNLTPGQYAMLVQLPGFKTSKTLLRIEPGSDVTQDVRLVLGTVAETLTITGSGKPGAVPIDRQVEGDTPPATQNAPDLAPAPPPPSEGPVRVGGDIREPKKIRDVKPAYPPDALAAGVQGIVIMEAVIATDGTVKDVQILRSVPGLDQAAVDAVRQWMFVPTTLNGVPVEVLMTVTVNFTLQ